MKGYKAFDADWTCRGFQYEIGKTYELPEGEELEICESGFHFCKNPIDVFGYYPYVYEGTKLAEIEALGDIQCEGTKYVTNKIKIVREFTPEELKELIIDPHRNTGINNIGIYNSGNHNTGNLNSGNFNSGKCNSGDFNSGYYNSGHCNTGVCNHGSWNSGDYNSGDCNSGDCNSGDYNSGRYNSGDYNSGGYNSGNKNSGYFNTDEPYMRMFNRPTSIRHTDFIESLDYCFGELMIRIHDNYLEPEDYDRIRNLPNFDAKIFKEITGIDIDEEEVEENEEN